MTMEERIEEAIIARFFEPTWLIQTQQMLDPQTGQYRTEVVPTQIPAPLSVVAQAVYAAAKEKILASVLEQLDIDAIVAQWAPIIAKDVVAKLQTTPDRWSSNPTATERRKMLDKVYEQVAEEFGRQCVEHLRQTGGLMGILDASPSTSGDTNGQR